MTTINNVKEHLENLHKELATCKQEMLDNEVGNDELYFEAQKGYENVRDEIANYLVVLFDEIGMTKDDFANVTEIF